MDSNNWLVIVTGEHDSGMSDGPVFHGDKPIQWVPWKVIDFKPLPIDPDVMKSVETKPFDWIFFTSPRAVRFWTEAVLEHGIEFPFETQVACIGPATVEAAIQDGFNPDFFPTEPGTETFLKEFADLLSNSSIKPRILIPSALGGRSTLRDTLTEWGCEVVWIPLYETVSHPTVAENLETSVLERADLLLFTSPSSIDAVLEKCKLPEHLRTAAIGNFTYQHLREKGFSESLLLPESDMNRVGELLC